MPNDDRAPTGTFRDGVLTVRLLAPEVAWRPDRPAGCALTAHAFAEEGRAAPALGPAFDGRSWPNTERLTYTVGDVRVTLPARTT